MKFFKIILLAAPVFFLACSRPTTTATTGAGTTQSGGRYSEDLSGLRPKVSATDTTEKKDQVSTDQTNQTRYVEAKYAINEKLDVVLDSISRFNLSMGFIDGYTIQIYSGLRNQDALEAKKKLTTSLPDLESELQYQQPNYRVRVGKYYDRFDAQKDYVAIKKFFPNAILIPERIPIKQ